MGHGYILRCKECHFEMTLNMGVGFLFPQVYQETMETAKSGEYGEVVQEFLISLPDGALNCENVLLQCPECGNLEMGPDLSMYIPGKDTKPREKGNWSVAFPFEGASYVAPWDLNDYELVRRFEHKCSRCGAVMKCINQKDMEKKPGAVLAGEKESEFLCPKCGKPLWHDGILMWD